jgi:predicted nucleotidyltransferase
MDTPHRLIQRLVDAGLEFVIIGGYAGVIHGSVHVTDDLDVCAVLSGENVEKIRRAFADIHPVHRITHRKLSFLDHPPPGEPLVNLYLNTDEGVVDILSDVLGVGDFKRLRQNAQEVELFGRKCRVISLNDLIVAKEAVAREHDLIVAKELRCIAAKLRQRGKPQ